MKKLISKRHRKIILVTFVTVYILARACLLIAGDDDSIINSAKEIIDDAFQINQED